MLVLHRTKDLTHRCNIEIREAMPEYSPRWPTDDRTSSTVYEGYKRIWFEMEGRLRVIVEGICEV